MLEEGRGGEGTDETEGPELGEGRDVMAVTVIAARRPAEWQTARYWFQVNMASADVAAYTRSNVSRTQPTTASVADVAPTVCECLTYCIVSLAGDKKRSLSTRQYCECWIGDTFKWGEWHAACTVLLCTAGCRTSLAAINLVRCVSLSAEYGVCRAVGLCCCGRGWGFGGP